MNKELKENWAIAPDRVREFFMAQQDVRPVEGGYKYKSCHISAVPMGKGSSPWAVERTELIFSGEREDVEEIHRRFFLRFLSAGG